MQFVKSIVVSAVVLAVCVCCASAERGAQRRASDEALHVQYAKFPEGATLDEKVAIAARLVPSERQLAWQRSELTAFLHFGINTFTDREWGNGREDPSLFNPSELDASQWVRTLKECGFEMVILTAKHHDGFCLWPTATTAHSVASSPWREGRGDVVAEVAAACREYGMKFGVYLSPWDRNAECYGDSPRYNDFFVRQLTELLTNYGDVSEVWFDGACGEGPNGKKQVYDWDTYLATIRRLQPDAVSAVMGEDVRWVGNEGGLGRETEWSATVITPGIYSRAEENNALNGVYPKAEDLGSRAKLATAREIFWYPSEVDVSIRPGWFWHERENSRVKSLHTLADIYFTSVGRNSVLLLNIPPDTRGLLNEADVERLREFAEWRRATFADNRVVRGDRLKALNAGDEAVYKLKKGSVVDAVMLCEHIEKGQRIEKFTVELLTDEGWRDAVCGTTVGCKRMVRFDPVAAKAVRVRIDECRTTALLDCVGAFLTASTLPRSEAVACADKRIAKVGVAVRTPLTLELTGVQPVTGFVYAPDGGEVKTSTAVRYSVEVSADGKTWRTVSEDEFGNIVNNPVPQVVEFASPVQARFFRIEGKTQSGTAARFEPSEVAVVVPAE